MNNKKVGITIGIVFLVVAAIGAIIFFLSKDGKETIYKVRFDNDGVVEVVNVKANDIVERPIDPQKEGYTFDGWYYNGTKFNFATEITKDITLEARWIEVGTKKWKITFDTVGGEYIESLNVVDGKKIDKIPTPKKEGYTFIGWYYNNQQFDFDTAITKDILLVAKWEKNKPTTDETTKVTKYIVKFDTAGGSTIPSQRVEKNKTASKPNDPTREGYEFLGWYNGNTKFDFKTKITKDITLTAKWKKIEKQEETKTYTVTFDTTGGNTIPSEKVEEGKTITKPSDPTRDGYTFIGWYHNDVQYNFSTPVTSNLTLVAKWEKISKITYKIETIEDSYVGQVRIFVIQDDVKVNGIVDIVTTNGKTVTKEISKDGYITNGKIIETITNVRVK